MEKAGADQQVLELDRDPVVAGPLEEDEARRPDLVEDPTSEGSRARALEPDQSTAHRLSAQETPTSKPGTGSEMPEGVLEPGQPDHRSREIPAPVSRLFDLASEKRSSQDRADLTARVPASTVMEYSSVKVRVEFCLLTACYRRDPTLVTEEAGAMA